MVKRPRLPFRIPFFRIFYSTTYTTLFLLILLLLAITPTTLIYTAIRASAYQYVFEIGGVYVLVVILTLFIYSSRLYTNRAVLAQVGKSWMPVQPGEVSKRVRKEVVKAANRSALIAYETKPRDLHAELLRQKQHSDGTATGTVGKLIPVDVHAPPWGHVQHGGWSCPSQLDDHVAPHIQFRSVIRELPNLIEARAVSLAPPTDTTSRDAALVHVLSRRPNADMRSYLAQLSTLGLIAPDAGQNFVQRYEHARFSPIPIQEAEFNLLMSVFADLLANMSQIPPRVLRMAQNNSSDSSLSYVSSRSDSISSSIAASVLPSRRPSSRLPSFYTPRASLSVARTPSPALTRRNITYSTPRPPTGQTGNTIYRTPSQQTFASVGSVRRTIPARRTASFVDTNVSFESLAGRLTNESQRSVIRLAPSSPLSSSFSISSSSSFAPGV
jgi:hypothetical protein